MASKALEATNKLVNLLESIDKEDRAKVIQAAFVLLGEQPVTFGVVGAPVPSVQGTGGVPANVSAAGTPGTAKAYFEAKKPVNKIEELAVAARFREEHMNQTTSTKEEIHAVVKEARRNFDASNYARDMNNAQRKGLFNKGGGRNAVLSHYGQDYVDALPDREAASGIPKPKRAGARKAMAKVASKKKAAAAK